MFDGEPPGAERDLSRPGSVASAHEEMQDSVRNQVAARGWFRKVPSAAATSGLGAALIALALFATLGLGFGSRGPARCQGALADDPTFADHHHRCCYPYEAQARAAHCRRPRDV